MSIAAPRRSLTVIPLTGGSAPKSAASTWENSTTIRSPKSRRSFSSTWSCISGQKLTTQEHLAFSERFGPFQFCRRFASTTRIPICKS